MHDDIEIDDYEHIHCPTCGMLCSLVGESWKHSVKYGKILPVWKSGRHNTGDRRRWCVASKPSEKWYIRWLRKIVQS